MYRVVPIILVVFLLAACAEQELPAGKRGRSFKLEDPKQQEQIIARLDAVGVPYIIEREGRRRGFVQTMMVDQATVDGIKREVLYGPNLDGGLPTVL